MSKPQDLDLSDERLASYPVIAAQYCEANGHGGLWQCKENCLNCGMAAIITALAEQRKALLAEPSDSEMKSAHGAYQRAYHDAVTIGESYVAAYKCAMRATLSKFVEYRRILGVKP